MLVHRTERHSRSVAKAISWRRLGSIDMFMLGRARILKSAFPTSSPWPF